MIYEYVILEINMNLNSGSQRLNAFAKNGWRVVSVQSRAEGLVNYVYLERATQKSKLELDRENMERANKMRNEGNL